MLRNPGLAAEMAAKRPLPTVGDAPWREGKLLPDDWDRMDSARKLTELYLGQRGAIFWVNKLAFGACISVVVGWIVFRFVGPALGLYELKESFSSPPNI